MLPGVKEARMVETPYKLISREYARLKGETEHRIIKVGMWKSAAINWFSSPGRAPSRVKSSFSKSPKG